MTTEPASPKRRHILSSINPEEYRSASPNTERPRTPSEEAPPREPQPSSEQAEAEEATETKERKRTTRFRFKSGKSSRSHRDRDYEDRDDRDGEESSHRHRRHRHHHHHHSSHHRHKRRRTRSRSPTPPNPYEPPPLGSDAAFRESLFDAMADDEGAAYWQNVYGQPIHIYPQTRPSRTGNNGENGDAEEVENGGENLERMDDDEYAAFVRQKMWEKTHQGLLEERARREERRKQREEQRQETARLAREMERSLRRGEERRRRKGWKERWEEYGKAWAAWDGAPEGMAWPVRSGRREDVDSAAVIDFFVMGIDSEDVGEAEFLAKLKDERVRWHPDKIQQKLGGKVDEAVMRGVTAVFQIVDKLWSDTRAKR
ncbi:hypothetical protein F4821DRAFT_225828 [Hypoxylon rubiginosum]|uniref:Uncharacterized protein n=1 Tax=Hypoxylon rubiginosum TaxID=110542 RepID=A0ACC0DGP1_9PEZI|nr:hypothetical protein F4821DRAFT_225828 [Hypoxylon rubiginosum]